MLPWVLLALIAAAAGLEGAVVPGFGGPIFAIGAAIAGIVVWRDGSDAPGRLVRIAALLLVPVALWHVLPMPPALTTRLAPGLAAWQARMAPEWAGDLHGWLDTINREDLLAAVGLPPETSPDLTAESVATAWRSGAVGGERAVWAGAQMLGFMSFYLLGIHVGRDERSARRFATGLVLLGVAEAFFGIANRSGPSTGLGPKLYYLGSATGTFINRGHYGAFLCLALAAGWGLAAALFPLEHEEVTRHRRHRLRSSQPPSLWAAAGDRIPRLGLLALAGGAIGVAAVASQSRGPLLGFGLASAAVGGWVWWRRGERFHLAIGLGVPLACGALSVLGFGVGGAFGRFVSLLDTDDVSFTSRWTVWREGWAAFIDSPWLGGGLGSWRVVRGVNETTPHLYDFQHAHNGVVERLAEQGVIGTVALGLLLVAWVRGSMRGLRNAEHDPRTAMGVAALVGVGAVALQSLGDFPLWTPGVAIPTAVMAGVAYGALNERGAAASQGVRVTIGPVLAAVGVVLAARATQLDRAVDAPRNEHVGEVPAVFLATRLPPPDVASARVQAATIRATTMRTPLDPWAQLALARTTVALARYAARGDADATGAPLEAHLYAADLALNRALALRPLDPHVQLAVGREDLLLARTGYAPDAWRARGAEHLVAAVRLDPWRAADAFRLAEGQPAATLDRIAEAAPTTGTAAARVWYAYGQALDRAKDPDKDPDGALKAYAHAAEVDPTFGPPWFQRGVILRNRGQDPAANEAFRAFLAARERPAGMEGWALLYVGELDNAANRLRRVVEEAPDNRWAWEGLAEVGRRQNDPAAELLAWRHVLTLAPRDPRALDRIRTLEASGVTPP